MTFGTSDRVREWWTVANLRRDLNHEIMNDTDFNLLLIVLLLLKEKEYLVIDGLLRLERILNIFLNPRPLRNMSVGLTS